MKAGFELTRHLFQFRKGSVNRAGAELAGAVDDAVAPPVDEDGGPFAHALVAPVALAGREVQATDVELPTANLAQHRIGHAGLTHADRIVEIGAHQSQRVSTKIVGKRL